MTIATIKDGAELVRRHFERDGMVISSITHDLIGTPTCNGMVAHYVVRSGSKHTVRDGELILKFYRDGRSAIAHEASKVLHASLREDDVLAVPEPHFYEGRYGIVAQQRCPGLACMDLFEHGKGVGVSSRIGRALACLHSQDEITGATKKPSDHIRELVRPHPRDVATAFPEFRPAIEAALCILKHADQDNSEVPNVPLHRDFQLRQMFLSDERIWVVDWDTFAFGDPAFDVAYFIAYLRTHFHQSEKLELAFLEGYCLTQPDSILVRLPVYLAFNFLRRACRRFRIRDTNWESELRCMMQMLDEILTDC